MPRPDATDPDPIEPDPTDPDPIEPDPTDPDPIEPDPTDPVLAALDELVAALRETAELNRIAIHRADSIRRLRGRGHGYREIVPMETRPLIVELLTQSLYDLADASSRFRKVEARALYSEGLTMAEIADLFGVTRQRIAALLRPSSVIATSMVAAASHLEAWA